MSREIVNQLDLELACIVSSLKELVNSVPQNLLYQNPPAVSIGENLLRSAAVIEQTCGGLTANLWDDPFEWTLPETLSDAERIIEYLSEVDPARQRAFHSILRKSAAMTPVHLHLTRTASVPTRFHYDSAAQSESVECVE